MTKTNNQILTPLLIVFGLDLAWAFTVATFGAKVLIRIAGITSGADEGAIQIATSLGWITSFVVAFVQGAIFLVVATVFVVVFVLAVKALLKLRRPKYDNYRGDPTI